MLDDRAKDVQYDPSVEAPLKLWTVLTRHATLKDTHDASTRGLRSRNFASNQIAQAPSAGTKYTAKGLHRRPVSSCV